MQRKSPDEKVVEDVKRFGWHVIKVLEEGKLPGYVFTIGLFQTHQHPEIVLVGLDLEISHRIVNLIGDQVKAGKTFEPDKIYPGILKGYAVIFKRMAKRWYEEYLGSARRFYKGNSFPALQCVWPDKERHFPWDKDYNERWRTKQPILE